MTNQYTCHPQKEKEVRRGHSDQTGSVASAEVSYRLREIQVGPPSQRAGKRFHQRETPLGQARALELINLGLIKPWTAASSVSLGLRQKVLSWSLMLRDFSAGEGDRHTVFLQALEFHHAGTAQ